MLNNEKRRTAECLARLDRKAAVQYSALRPILRLWIQPLQGIGFHYITDKDYITDKQ